MSKRLLYIARQYENLPEIDPEDEEFEQDVWEDDDYYAYADSFVTSDEFEDQAGMIDLKKTLKIPNEWILIKVVNFNAKKLEEMIAWLAENCQHGYRRVGWSSGCSTKVGIAFEDAVDAVMYKLRWV